MCTQPGPGQRNQAPAHGQAVNSRPGLAFQGWVWTCTPSLESQEGELHWQLSLQRENTAAAGGRSVSPRGRDPQRAAEERPARVGEGGPQPQPEQCQASSLLRWSPRKVQGYWGGGLSGAAIAKHWAFRSRGQRQQPRTCPGALRETNGEQGQAADRALGVPCPAEAGRPPTSSKRTPEQDTPPAARHTEPQVQWRVESTGFTAGA